jgi:hypothetical protein
MDPNQVLVAHDTAMRSSDPQRRQRELEQWFAVRAVRAQHRRARRKRSTDWLSHWAHALVTVDRRRRSFRTS